MDDREPTGPFEEALRRSPAENARDADRTMDSPDRREVTEANEALHDEAGKPRPPLLPGERTIPPD